MKGQTFFPPSNIITNVEMNINKNIILSVTNAQIPREYTDHHYWFCWRNTVLFVQKIIIIIISIQPDLLYEIDSKLEVKIKLPIQTHQLWKRGFLFFFVNTSSSRQEYFSHLILEGWRFKIFIYSRLHGKI